MTSYRRTALPILEVIDDLLGVLRSRTRAVLQAPPGAGKTTIVPLALLDEPWVGERRILMLEPRRLATRGAATRMASLLGEPVGRRVGYRMRMESRTSPQTRIEVVTEGILTRMLQSDPALDGVAAVIFDEYHERSLQADLGLALTLQSQSLLREDLRLLVMSATLDGARVASLLDDAPVISSEGRSFPVERRHRPAARDERIEESVGRLIGEALREEEGDLLVFLPGMAQIRRVEERMQALAGSVAVLPLHGALPPEAQERAITPDPHGRRRVILSTSIAETSLTIEGIRVVVDSGLMRLPRYDPSSGMTRLETTRVSRASAEQRAGRAGRLAPGVCYRLWSAADEEGLLPFTPPEILEADLVPLALELAAWGVRDPSELRWLDPPPAGSFAAAVELLQELHALDQEGLITSHGRELAPLPLHPRLAHMLVVADDRFPEGLATACDLAALLSERDILPSSFSDPDLRLRLDIVAGRGPIGAADRGGVERVRRMSAALRRDRGAPGEARETELAGALLALAYPDRIAARRSEGHGRFLLRNGRAAVTPDVGVLPHTEMIVVGDIDGAGREGRVRLAAPVDRALIIELFDDDITRERSSRWDDEAGLVRVSEVERLGAIVLSERTISEPTAEEIERALLDAVRDGGLDLLPWTRAARGLQQRAIFLRHHRDDFPDLSDQRLLASLDEWLPQWLRGVRRRRELERIEMATALNALLSWEEQRLLESEAPTHLTVPSGSRIPIDYSDPHTPVLAVRLQEVFGLTETPRVGGVPITMHLLSPAQRPVQVTRDLASFWRTTYFEVRKDLKGRYPKHYWPDDPLVAEPTARAKRRGG